MSELPGLDGLLGVRHVEVGADKVVVQFTIGEQHLQPFGIPHGGIYCAVHESTASVAAYTWITEQGEDKLVVGTNNVCDFLRQASVGDTITVTATPDPPRSHPAAVAGRVHRRGRASRRAGPGTPREHRAPRS